MPGTQAFDQAVEQLHGLLTGAAGPPPDMSVVERSLVRLARSHVRGLSEEEGLDIAGQALYRFIRAVREGRLDPGRPAAAYLTKIVTNEAISHARRKREGASLSSIHDPAGEDHRLIRFLEVAAARTDLSLALTHARELGDTLTLLVVGAWLDLASRQSKDPSTREVAASVGISHTSVRTALGRLRSYFPTGGPPT